MIVTSTIGQTIVPLIQQFPQLHSIYVLSNGQEKDELWIKTWNKVRGVFSELGSIFNLLKQAMRQCVHDSIPISILSPTAILNRNVDELDQSFMYSLILKEILLEIGSDARQKNDFIDFWRIQYCSNESQLRIIDEFERDYELHSPIWWYTKEFFLYWTLNRALRTQDSSSIIKMGFFLRDLQRQIQQLHIESLADRYPLTVYRGQGMTKIEFEKMSNNIGGLLSFNNFLSTSTDEQISRLFSESVREDPNLIPILLEIKIDMLHSSTPFASLDNISYYESEREILFGTHTVFRIGQMRQIEDGLWLVELTLTKDNDRDLECLTECLREETRGSTGWYRLGNLLLKMGNFDEAQKVYKILLDSTPTTDRRVLSYIFHQLGCINLEKGDLKSALSLFQNTHDFQQELLPPDHPDLAVTHRNIGNTYYQMADYSTALTYFQKALESQQKSLPPNHLSLANTNNSIGSVYYARGDYTNAIIFYQETLKIREHSLPHNHPSLAIAYSNIGDMYQQLGKYSTALSFFQKTRQLQERSLPSNHPTLATTYMNIGVVCYHMGDYSTALSFFHQALEIQQNSLPSNNIILAKIYINIASIYREMEDYSSALLSMEKTLEIQQSSLSLNHVDLAVTYNNIGDLHKTMGNFSTALSFLQKALEIRLKSLPSDHPSLATTYNNIGCVYRDIREYSTALSFYQRTLKIFEKSLNLYHPLLAMTYNSMAIAFEGLLDYHAALEHAERAVGIAGNTLESNHPNQQYFRETLRRIRGKL